MKVLITGISGFVGPHLARELIAAGHEVVGLDRPGTEPPAGAAISDFVRLDLAEADAVLPVLERMRPGAIAHLAGWSHVGSSWKHPAEVFNANVVATLRLHEAIGRMDTREPVRFLFASSADVFGEVPAERLPISESTPVSTRDPYAASKEAAERVLALLHQRGGMELMIARPFNHIGPGQRGDFACPSFARQIAAIEAGAEPVVRHGNLSSRRDFLDVRDVVRAYRAILEKGHDGDLYVIASGVAHSLEDILKRLCAIAGVSPRFEKDPSLFRPYDAPERRGDAAFLMARTGWKPEISLDQTLTDILEEARALVRQGVA